MTVIGWEETILVLASVITLRALIFVSVLILWNIVRKLFYNISQATILSKYKAHEPIENFRWVIENPARFQRTAISAEIRGYIENCLDRLAKTVWNESDWYQDKVANERDWYQDEVNSEAR